MKPIELEISGIKCDVCAYRDDTIEFKDYATFVNKPCPDCESNLLTTKEYNDCLRMYRVVNIINKIRNITKWINPLYYFRKLTKNPKETVTITKIY